MSGGADLFQALFHFPGRGPGNEHRLLALAAGAHGRIFMACQRRGCTGAAGAEIEAYLKGPATAAGKRALLDAPQMIQALHAIAAEQAGFFEWGPRGFAREASWGRAALGNFAVTLALRNDPRWCGRVDLAADDYGAVRFWSGPWVILLTPTGDGNAGSIPDRLQLELTAEEAVLTDPSGEVVALGPRAALVSLVAGAESTEDWTFPRDDGGPRASLAHDQSMADAAVHFEPALGAAGCPHAGATAQITDALLETLARHSPGVYAEFRECIGLIRGLETIGFADGTLASFSSPLAPGEMGINICYDGDQPRLDPFCFMWLGHELGHTRSYLIGDAGFIHGWRFLDNPDEMTRPIPRYGRSLPVRTLFQVPYVHLYELVVLLDFFNGDFAGLPWRCDRDAAEQLGADVLAEIDESFDLLAHEARLTRLGAAAVAHFRCLTAEAKRQWNRRAA